MVVMLWCRLLLCFLVSVVRFSWFLFGCRVCSI